MLGGDSAMSRNTPSRLKLPRRTGITVLRLDEPLGKLHLPLLPMVLTEAGNGIDRI